MALEPNKANAMDHVVLVLFENRSFDNLLGYLTGPDGVQVVDGVVGKVLTNPVPTGVEPVPAGEPGAPDLVTYAPAPDWRTPDPDPGEEHQHTNTQLFNILDAGNRADPSVSINGSGQYIVSYTSNDNGDLNIRGRIGHL